MVNGIDFENARVAFQSIIDREDLLKQGFTKEDIDIAIKYILGETKNLSLAGNINLKKFYGSEFVINAEVKNSLGKITILGENENSKLPDTILQLLKVQPSTTSYDKYTFPLLVKFDANMFMLKTLDSTDTTSIGELLISSLKTNTTASLDGYKATYIKINDMSAYTKAVHLSLEQMRALDRVRVNPETGGANNKTDRQAWENSFMNEGETKAQPIIETSVKNISNIGNIYSQLGNKTQSENVVIKSWSELKDVTKAITSESIVATRIKNSNEHFGNPFSHDPVGKTQGLIKTETIKEAVEKYADWVLNAKTNFYTGKIKPEQNTIFVFGSNPEGRHGAGAAKIAKEQFGAIYGQGEGIQGNSYAIPTKDIYKYTWGRTSNNSYEVSSQGDKRFSALYAKLKDGRTIEEAYQLDIKGFREQGNDWKLGKGKAPLRKISKEQSWDEYKNLWRTYLKENPELEQDLREKARGKVLTDKFAATDVSQARALSEILNENNGYKSISPKQITESIKKLYEVARQNPNKQFKIGYTNTIEKSLNGYTGLEMIEMFNQAGETPSNIVFSEEWKNTGKLLNSRAEWIKNQLESGEHKGKAILYYKELGEPSHATALDYLINKYDWSNSKQETITQPTITEEKISIDTLQNIEKDFVNFKTEDKDFYLDSKINTELKISPVDFCYLTANLGIHYLQSKNINVFPAKFTIFPNKKVGNFGFPNHHFVAVAFINNELYLFDQPQNEYIVYDEKLKTHILKEYKPRFIKVTNENMNKYYEMDAETTNKLFYNPEKFNINNIPRQQIYNNGVLNDSYVKFDGSIYDWFLSGSPIKIGEDFINSIPDKPINSKLSENDLDITCNVPK
jgi:hypothetical protein